MEQLIPRWSEIKSDRNRINLTVIILSVAAMFMAVLYVMNYFEYASTKSILQYEYEQKVSDEIAHKLGLRSAYDEAEIDEKLLANFNPNDLIHKERIKQNDTEVKIYYNGIIYTYNTLGNPLEHTCEPEDSMKVRTIFVMLFAFFVFASGILAIMYATNGQMDHLLGASKARGYMQALRDIENNNVDYNLQMYQVREATEKAERQSGFWKGVWEDIKEGKQELEASAEKEKAKKAAERKVRIEAEKARKAEEEAEARKAAEAEENSDDLLNEEMKQILDGLMDSAQEKVKETEKKPAPKKAPAKPKTTTTKKTSSTTTAKKTVTAKKATASTTASKKAPVKKATTTKKEIKTTTE